MEKFKRVVAKTLLVIVALFVFYIVSKGAQLAFDIIGALVGGEQARGNVHALGQIVGVVGGICAAVAVYRISGKKKVEKPQS